MGQAAGQKAGNEYHKGLMGYFSDCNNTVQIRQSRAEETEADYFRAHCRTNNVSSKTYYKRGYDYVGEITVNNLSMSLAGFTVIFQSEGFSSSLLHCATVPIIIGVSRNPGFLRA